MAFKYEIEAEERIKAKDWSAEFKFFKEFGLADHEVASLLKTDFLSGASPCLRQSFSKNYDITEDGIVRRGRKAWETVPEITMECAKSDGKKSGLYFLGMIGITPDEKKYHLVKVGWAQPGRPIESRVNDYRTYNPMIYHNNSYLETGEFDVENGKTAEDNCHWYIAERAYGRAQGSHEWFYVDEETYYELCETFADKEMFKAIAEGRD